MRGKGRAGVPCKGLSAEQCRTGTRTRGAAARAPLGQAGPGSWPRWVTAARALEAEAERWFLWLPVLFAAGILTYFALFSHFPPSPNPRLAIALVLGALEEDCRTADIIIAPSTIGKGCRAARVIVDHRVLKEDGAHALYIEGLSIRTETVAGARGARPWVRHSNGTPAE